MAVDAPVSRTSRSAEGIGHSHATRYLCVGAQIDGDFAQKVIREVVEARQMAIAPSFGIDLVPVVRHALSGRRRRTVRDLLIAAVVAVNLAVNPIITVLTAVIWLMTRQVYRYIRQRWPRHPRTALSVAAVSFVVIGGTLGFVTLLLQWLVLTVAATFSWSASAPMHLITRLFGSLTPFTVTASFIAVFAILLGERLMIRELLVQSLRWDSPRTLKPPPVLDREHLMRLHAIRAIQDRSNVTVYSGEFPFLGAGDELRTWSFAVDLSRGPNGLIAGEGGDGSFSIAELQRYVGERLEALSSPDLDAAQRIVGLVIEDRLFVYGGHLHGDTRFLPDPARPPLPWVDRASDVMDSIIGDPRGLVRHFKCIRAELWSQEVILSVFLHLAFDGRTLYVEETACLLPPIRAEYRVVDALTRSPLPDEIGSLLWTVLKDVPAGMLRAPAELWRTWLSKLREQRQDEKLRRLIDEQMPIDYGARTSIRELGAATRCDNWFQKLDAIKHLKVIELQVFNAILDFLEKHGVDTAEFRARQATIQNYGIMMQGGTIANSVVAAGPGASAAPGGDGSVPSKP